VSAPKSLHRPNQASLLEEAYPLDFVQVDTRRKFHGVFVQGYEAEYRKAQREKAMKNQPQGKETKSGYVITIKPFAKACADRSDAII